MFSAMASGRISVEQVLQVQPNSAGPLVQNLLAGWIATTIGRPCHCQQVAAVDFLSRG
jgi:hypothetical protein